MQPGAAVPAVARGDHDQASHLQRVERNMTHERVRQSEISDFAAVREKLRTIFLRSSFSIRPFVYSPRFGFCRTSSV